MSVSFINTLEVKYLWLIPETSPQVHEFARWQELPSIMMSGGVTSHLPFLDAIKLALRIQRKPQWTKPKMLWVEKAILKPKISDFVEDSEGNDGESSDDDDNNEKSESIRCGYESD